MRGLQQMQKQANVRQMKKFIIVFGVLFFVFMLFGSYFHCFTLKSWEMAGILLIHILCMILFGGLAIWLLKKEQDVWYQKLYLSFWGIIILELTVLAWLSKEFNISMILIWTVIILPSAVPYFTRGELILLFIESILSGIFILHTKHGGWEQIGCIISWYLTAGYLFYVRYKSLQKIYQQEKELQEAIHEADTDSMTKIFNRRGLYRRICTIVPYCIHNKVPIAILMIDIDNFKIYNDTFGHIEGDSCIQIIAAEIKKSIRKKMDLAARVGGEEFLVFLTELGEEDAINWGKRLQNSITAKKIPQSEKNFCPFVSISIGLSYGIFNGRNDFENLWKQADEELFYAKENGRNCLFFHGNKYEI
ncbi:MAG: GGDEF domain-containing protein [Lachnospiraceae bacterium]|nr:GGDEF domain-containing protein [Lachnospiraceae bacterium]